MPCFRPPADIQTVRDSAFVTAVFAKMRALADPLRVRFDKPAIVSVDGWTGVGKPRLRTISQTVRLKLQSRPGAYVRCEAEGLFVSGLCLRPRAGARECVECV